MSSHLSKKICKAFQASDPPRHLAKYWKKIENFGIGSPYIIENPGPKISQVWLFRHQKNWGTIGKSLKKPWPPIKDR